MDEVEEVQSISFHPFVKPLVYSLAGFLVGVGVGYFLAQRQRRLPPPPPEELAKISAEVDALRAKREAKEVVTTIIIEEEEEGPTLMEEMIADPDTRTEGPDIIVTRMADEGWDYEVEKQTRDSLAPYVIHRDEFWNNEMELQQNTWTYYEGDDVMINEEDIVVYNHDEKVGELKWGHGSGDPNSVYIRNEKLRMEVEVLREPGLYSIEVMGLEPDRGEDKDVKHSNTRRNKRTHDDE